MNWLDHHKLSSLIYITIANILILIIRNGVVGNHDYNFLLFNLFLGAIPLIIVLLVQHFQSKISHLLFWCAGGLWLLFYPNAPYMITDLIHVQASSTTVLYDTLIIYSLATLSLFFGFISLRILYLLIYKKYNSQLAINVIIFSIILCSFGIYLGRILRLNSWDLFTHPIKVLVQVFNHLWPVHQNPSTYYIVFLFSFIQLFILYLTKDLDNA